MDSKYQPQEKSIKPRYLPDTVEQVAQTFQSTGFKDKVASAFLKAIARVKGKK